MPRINVINNDFLAAVKTLKKIVSREYLKDFKSKSFFISKTKKRKLRLDSIIKRKIEGNSFPHVARKVSNSGLKVYTNYEKTNFVIFDSELNKLTAFEKNDLRNTYKKSDISFEDLQKFEQ